jgi:DNA-binding HxlR family transcriptional regulator
MRKSNKPLTHELKACPVARTLEIVGEKWTTLILRDLFLRGAVRFQELQSSLPGVAPSTLSARLKGLEAQGIIEQRLYSDHPPRSEYLLTEKGQSLGPILKALRDWGTRYA